MSKSLELSKNMIESRKNLKKGVDLKLFKRIYYHQSLMRTEIESYLEYVDDDKKIIEFIVSIKNAHLKYLLKLFCNDEEKLIKDYFDTLTDYWIYKINPNMIK